MLEKIYELEISIHTPAKGVTIYQTWKCSPQAISIHTPAKGVTYGVQADSIETGNFNPHSREGSDNDSKDSQYALTISIHTPAKGVTLPFIITTNLTPISIHTPAKGVTLLFRWFVLQLRFQSTLPRRE